MAFIISQNLISTLGDFAQFATISKICDFCGKLLPTDYNSKKCRACPTIYDECDECLQQYRSDHTLCHKNHTGSIDDNNSLTEDEKKVILDCVKEKALCQLYGISILNRIDNKKMCDSCMKTGQCERYQKVDITDSFRHEETFPNIFNVINKGMKIYMEVRCGNDIVISIS